MEAKYSKGEWIVLDDDEGGKSTMVVSVVPYRAINKTICDTQNNRPFDSSEYDENLANAKLIAAAPDLIESAEKNIEYIRKIKNALPDPESMDYDPGDILMRIEGIIISMEGNCLHALKKATE